MALDTSFFVYFNQFLIKRTLNIHESQHPLRTMIPSLAYRPCYTTLIQKETGSLCILPVWRSVLPYRVPRNFLVNTMYTSGLALSVAIRCSKVFLTNTEYAHFLSSSVVIRCSRDFLANTNGLVAIYLISSNHFKNVNLSICVAIKSSAIYSCHRFTRQNLFLDERSLVNVILVTGHSRPSDMLCHEIFSLSL